MIRKKDVDKYTVARPFKPFEVGMVDGQRFRFTKLEQFLAGRDTLVTLDRRGDAVFISIGLITTIGSLSSGGKRRRAGGA